MQDTTQSHSDELIGPMGSPNAPETIGPRAENRTSWGKWLLISVIVMGALLGVLVVFVIFGALLFGVRGFESSAPGPVELAVVEGAPPADLVMVVSPVAGSGEMVDQRFLDANMGSGQPLEPGSAFHVATVTTPYDSYELFRWREVSTTKGLIGDVQSCSGGMGNRGGYASCGGSDVGSEPTIGSGITQSGDQVSFSLSVDNLDRAAKWLVVDTESGFQVATEIVEGMGYLEWPAGGPVQANLTKVRALDEAMIEVWSGPAQ